MNKNRSRILAACFTLILLFCVLFLAWYAPSASRRTFDLNDIEKSLETSKGRERKQQNEYNDVVAEIPVIREKIDQIKPDLAAAELENKELKAERKELRARKKELEEMLKQSDLEETVHE